MRTNLGRLLWEMGKVDEAVDQFCEAIGTDPLLGPAVYNLGVGREAQGYTAEALSTWDSFLARADRPDSDEWKQKMHQAVSRLHAKLGSVPPTLSHSVQGSTAPRKP